MMHLTLTGQEQYILLQALNCFKEDVEKSDFKSNSIFTKKFVVNHTKSLTTKINKLEEKFEVINCKN